MQKRIDNLTDNEAKALVTLVNSCLRGIAGKRPDDFNNDGFVWINANDLIENGWSRHEAAGTLSALEKKGFAYLSGEDSHLNVDIDESYDEFDAIWDGLVARVQTVTS